MKIAFLCGSLELGRDGVGDYTRRLAIELVRQNHQSAIVALNDTYITENLIATEYLDDIELPILRLPAQWPIGKRYEMAKSWIDTFDPDFLSLQFVIFSFHPKGLPLTLSKILLRLGGRRKWHIMLHELWVGMATNDTLKRRLWGVAQRFLINRLLEELNPALIHTQCELYFQQLIKEGYQVNKLPLFSNIKVYSSVSSIKDCIVSNDDAVKFIFFGGLHPESRLVELITEVKKISKFHNKHFEFLYVGRNGDEIKNHINILNAMGVKHEVFGELNPQDISRLLSFSSFGIATGSPQMLEKNGTVIAMLDHKLPVICIGRDLKLKNNHKIEMPYGTYAIHEIEHIFSDPPLVNRSNTVCDVATKYISDLALTK
jgi:hypothetical protein